MHEVLVNCLFKLAQEKSVVRCTDGLNTTIAVDLVVKSQAKPNNSKRTPYEPSDNSIHLETVQIQINWFLRSHLIRILTVVHCACKFLLLTRFSLVNLLKIREEVNIIMQLNKTI